MLPATNPSVALTDGIRVTVTSRYLPEQSNPPGHRYVWAYTVQLENVGDRPAKLVTRHWIITDARGKVDEVKGPGVVGEQPHLSPGERFQYTSGCILQTPRGTMHGAYQMVRDDGAQFDAEIAPFSLRMPLDLN
ncbi:MAG TPA: Co2+/Mg2+ efflux protein ApaG [Sandaracinaceae bacterium LLY-WYZ-13_1]|nr:Co2+/Mg2+ efflux protein ApaG [Sandaracinaceae bacterium LLY-WYZ-13_1]